MSTSFIQISDCHIDDETLVMYIDSTANLERTQSDIQGKTLHINQRRFNP